VTEKVILLVEDSVTDEELALRSLRRNQMTERVVVVRDGAEALEYLFCEGPYSSRNPEELPQVVLLDLNLPKIGGLEVLQRLRSDRRTRLLPVVILTSSREEQDLLRGYEFGANSYVVKPVDFTQFADTIRQLGVYWLTVNQGAPPRAGRHDE